MSGISVRPSDSLHAPKGPPCSTISARRSTGERHVSRQMRRALHRFDLGVQRSPMDPILQTGKSNKSICECYTAATQDHYWRLIAEIATPIPYFTSGFEVGVAESEGLLYAAVRRHIESFVSWWC